MRSVMRAHILPRFADRPLSSITRFDVGRMLNEMVASGRSPSTAERVGTHTAAALLATAGDNPKRLGHEGSFAI